MKRNLDADTLTAHFSPEGWISKLDASGAVHGLRSGAAEKDEAKADAGTLDMWPRFSQPKELNLSGNVLLKTKLKKTGDARILQTSAFHMQFSGGGEAPAQQAAKSRDSGRRRHGVD